MVTPINPSDLLFIAYWQVPLEDCDVRTPSGWTQLIPYDKILGFALFAKKAVGDEDSTVVNIITDGPTTSMAAAWRVVSWEGQWGLVNLEDCVKVTGANQGMSSYPDPPPIWWGDWPAVPTLVYGFGLAELDTNSLPPSNMGEAFDQAINGTQDVSLAIGYTTTGAVDSFNPNVFGMNAEAYWQAFTLAVRGTSAGTWVMGFPEPQGDNGRFIIAYQEHIGSTYQVHTHLEATGIPIIKGDDVTTRVEDLDSQLKYGVLSWENTANLFRSPSDAEAYGQYILDRYAERHPILSLTYVASQDELYYGQAKARRVGDRIAIIADNGSGLGIAQDFFIEAISHRVVRGRHEVGYESESGRVGGHPMREPALPQIYCPTSKGAAVIIPTEDDGDVRIDPALLAPPGSVELVPHDWHEMTLPALPSRSRIGATNGWYCTKCLAIIDVAMRLTFRFQFLPAGSVQPATALLWPVEGEQPADSGEVTVA